MIVGIVISIIGRNRLIPTGLEPVLNHSEKSYIAFYYRQFFENSKLKRSNMDLVLSASSGQITKLCIIGFFSMAKNWF